MYITSVQIENYKSLWKTDKIDLSENFNVIIGENNTGKTAFLECIALHDRILRESHLSLSTSPVPLFITQSIVKIKLSVNVTIEELVNMLKSYNPRLRRVYIPLMEIYKQEYISNPTEIFNRIYKENIKVEFIVSYETQQGNQQRQQELISFDFCRTANTPQDKKVRVPSISYALQDGSHTFDSSEYEQLIIHFIPNIFEKYIHFFKAERLSIGMTPIGTNRILTPDASNLAEVLNNLQSIPHTWHYFKKLVQSVFPQVSDISVEYKENYRQDDVENLVEVKLWSDNTIVSPRNDLSISLSKSGTGIGQVLAMLYVVVISETPTVILIDEPQSFLHPGAIRKLFEIFKQHPQHQYIITTHSPMVISAANPDTILLLHKEGAESILTVIDKNQTKDMERVLRSVGASLSDVFGADNVLWVEGPTEEKCFPEILRILCKLNLRGTVVKSVVATGDFVQKKKKNVSLVLDIYRRLTTSSALLPPAFGFIFDTENLTQENITDIEREGTENGIQQVVFIPRMMYENYLLHSEAIALILSKSSGKTITTNQIQGWFDNNIWEHVAGQKQWNTKYFGRRRPPSLNFDDALETIHGTNVLKDLFKALTPDALVEYDNDKVAYSYEITLWLLENKTEQLQPLADFLHEKITHWERSVN